MSAPPRRWARWLAGRAVICAVLALVALPLYLTISPGWRPAAVRLACALALAVGCARARRWARDAVAPDAPSAFDTPPPAPPGLQLDAAFVRLRDDLVASARSRRYFDIVLWPRLTALAGPPLPRPAARRVLPRRGPSRHTLEELVAEIERRS